MILFVMFIFGIPTYKKKERVFKIKPTMVSPDVVIVEVSELVRHLRDK